MSISLKGEEIVDEVVLTEHNINGNKIYEKGYKFVYEKYGLELYEYEFARMTAKNYGRSTEIKCVFTGNKVILITAMISDQHKPYVLWKEEKTNVQEVKNYL